MDKTQKGQVYQSAYSDKHTVRQNKDDCEAFHPADCN